jgi:hypothetical protein
MTLATTSRKIQHNGNGTLATFSYDFRVDKAIHVEVYITDANGTDYLQSDYTVSGTLGDPLGGYIIFGGDSIPAASERVTIIREVPYTQDTDLIEGGLFRAETVEAQFDSTVMQVQQLAEADDRTIKAPISDVGAYMILPTAAERALNFPYFDANGDLTIAEGQLIESTHNHDSRYLLLLGSDATSQTISGSLTTTRDMTARHMNASGNIKQAGTQVSLVGHTHDDRYYTETELNAGQLDNRYYTESEVDTISGSIQSQIDGLTVDHGELTGLLDDDHTQYLLRADFTTYSGAIVDQIPVVEDTSPQLGGDLELNEFSIDATADLSSDHSYSGDIETVQVDVNATGFGAALYIAADFNYEEADADAAATMPCVALAVEAGTGSKLVLKKGNIRDDSWNWSAGVIYVSATAGAMTQTAPAGSGDQVQVVGYATSADTMYFDPDFTVIEVA